MKNSLLKNVVLGVLVAGIVGASQAQAANITLNGADPYQGYMNVFNLPSDGGAYQFGSGWGVPDLSCTFAGNNLTFTPNTIGDPNPYWYIGGGGPGHPGNKIMDANMYCENVNGAIPGATVNFSGMVLSNTLTSAHVVKAFIRDFAPDFSSNVEHSAVLPTSGSFSLNLVTVNDPARHVQYGFQMVGPCVWITDIAQFGKVVIGPTQAVPTKATSWGRMKSLYR